MKLHFRRVFGSVLAGTLLALSGSPAIADDCQCPAGRGTYVGIFGGGGSGSVDTVTQSGTALLPDAAGGPLAVSAAGNGDSHGVGLVGVHIGHEWAGRSLGSDGWRLLPAFEFEGFYLGGTQRANIDNITTRLPQHNFDVTLPMDTGVFLTNAVFSFAAPGRRFNPYVGAGIGAAGISISGADSLQLAPLEAGVNHFNSGTDSSCWGFAAQAKVGVRLPLSERFYLFGEYRLLYVGSTTYNFGSTVSPGHVPTTPWNVHLSDSFNHVGVAGIGFSF